ncbi:MAG: nitrate reductase cytochrome c-type subunit [Verrucomicrobiales bacterium]
MDNHEVETYFRQRRKTLAVVFLMIGMLAVSGFFMGMRQTERQVTRGQLPAAEIPAFTPAEIPGAPKYPEIATAEIPDAPKYPEIAATDWLANRDWKFTLANLPRAAAPPADLSPPTEEEAAVAIERRRSLRAYSGAPPVVPHAIDSLRSTACMSCHSEAGNLVIGGKRPPEISHPWITNCTSCHVPADGLRQLTAAEETRLHVENEFLGKASAGKGSRAYPTAPPTMPHPVWMRQNCMACHGPGREQAIRTSHPERRNCLQCHAPNAAFDNRETYSTNPKPPIDPTVSDQP